MKLHSVIIQIRRPSENGEDPGEVAYGQYTYEGDEVVLVDQRCVPLGDAYSAKVRQGEDANVVAQRLLRQWRRDMQNRKRSRFSSPINYPKFGIV
jgi:hypothetical protein